MSVHVLIFTFSKQAFNESLDFCKPHESHNYEKRNYFLIELINELRKSNKLPGLPSSIKNCINK